jgi:hypothetical protein
MSLRKLHIGKGTCPGRSSLWKTSWAWGCLNVVPVISSSLTRALHSRSGSTRRCSFSKPRVNQRLGTASPYSVDNGPHQSELLSTSVESAHCVVLPR